MSISIILTQTDKEISSLIHKAYARELVLFFKKKEPQLIKSIKDVTRQVLLITPEIIELRNGILRADFGLTVDPTASIIEAIVDSVNVKATPIKTSRNSITGGFKITIQPTNYQNLYALDVSTQAIKNGVLPWLKWLLEAGDTILIVDFGVEYGPYGRTGQAHMVKETRPFKVNSNYSGTKGDNFISKAFQANEQKFKNIIIKVLS